ncbi:MAG TPA: prolyl oligopeptidase family serine peptidase [Kineosporiaceae bacterium]|nr:prolyl oligopeptidase family serine peptidase [Kineosporiaceae bacterium]
MSRPSLPYGSWPSPIAPTALVAGASTPTDTQAEGGRTWWSQTRPDQAGRIQVVRRDADGTVHDALPDGWNSRTRVHEYGGGAWWAHDGVLFTASWQDQCLYRAEPGSDPVILTPQPPQPHAFRYADGDVTPDGSMVICVREDHARPAEPAGTAVTPDRSPAGDARNELVAISARPGPDGPAEPVVLVAGHDFVAAPRISPDGRRLAWITWEHPDMPWDVTALWVADLVPNGETLALQGIRRIAGGRESGIEESLLQPQWSADGRLFVVSDRSNWWNVYRVDELDGGQPGLVALHPVDAEVGQPAWVFGQSRYAIAADGTVWFTYSAADGAHLVSVAADGAAHDHRVPFGSLQALRADGNRLVALATSPLAEAVVVEFGVGPGPQAPVVTVLREPRNLLAQFGFGPESVSRPRRISFPSGERTAHAWLYLPAHAEVEGPEGQLPPLLVSAHGGPTGAADPSLRLAVQFWTSRGFAYADVDYGGSTGYGRTYRRLLDGAWGIVDIEDVCAAARWLAGQGLVDPERTAIRGGSAGGYTTLLALAVTDVFAAGASHYGVADLGALARDTHKFESRYLDGLVGPWPQAAEVYAQRSPLSHVDGFDRPLIVLQGDEDAVVPPAQAELIVSALERRGIPHAYLLFAGEQHGFRKAENIIAAIQAELSFYGQVFGFVPAGDVPRVEVRYADRLPSRS